jgi:hypothetical protein
MITKTFKRRSSATDVLRQLGVKPRDYNLFIEGSEPEVTCKIELAQSHVAGIATQTAAPLVTHDANLKTEKPNKEPRRYVVNATKIKYHETARGVQARAVIEVNGKTFARFDDYPERVVADIHFTNADDRKHFLADARAAGFAESSDDFVISEFARKLVHDAEARFLAEAEATRRAKPAKPATVVNFPAAPKIQKPAADQPKAKKQPKPDKAEVPKTAEAKRTVTSVARELIVAGKTNEEVWDALVKEFKLDEGKKSYPAWYRRDCVKRGLIQPAKS